MVTIKFVCRDKSFYVPYLLWGHFQLQLKKQYAVKKIKWVNNMGKFAEGSKYWRKI